jgi:pyruvate dehydrogenase (quinone)
VSSGIVSDVGDFLDALLPEIGVDETTVDSRWGRLEALRASIDDEATVTGSSSPLRPQRVVGVLNDLLTDRHRIVLDAGNNRIFHYRFLRMPAPGRVHMCGGHLGMGWGPSAALAAAMLCPDDRVLSIVGDGGMQMALPALAFAAAHQLPLTFIVMNNGVLGNVLDAQKAGRYAVDLPPIDYTAVAQAFGLSARRVDTDSAFDDAVRVADRLGGPALIEVMTDAGESSGQLRVRG